jgi:hypothetical protein
LGHSGFSSPVTMIIDAHFSHCFLARLRNIVRNAG